MNELPRLSDEQYLIKIVQSFYLHYHNSIAGIKNKNSVHLATTDAYAKLVGVCKERIIGHSDIGIASFTSNEHKLNFHRQDRVVEQTKKIHKFLNIQNYSSGFDAFIFVKSPLINPFTKNVVGTKYVCEKLIVQHIKHFFINNNVLVLDLNIIKFSERETEILFFMVLGFNNHKQIALLINLFKNDDRLTHDNVRYSVKRMLKITGCFQSDDLLDCLAQSNYSFLMPKSLMRPNSFFMGLIR